MDSQPRFDSLHQEAFLNLWRSYDRLRAIEDDFFAQYGLTPQQYNVLRVLRSRHPQPLNTLVLADRLVSRAPDITRMLDRLEEHGLVQRLRPPENRRTVRVGITAKGLELVARITAPLAKCHHRQLGHLSEDAIRQLIDLLRAAREPHEPTGSAWNVSAELVPSE